MAANKTFRSGPVALTTTLTTNILNPPAASGGVGAGSSGNYILVRQLHVSNKTGSPATFTLYLGGTGGNVAGTELFTAVSVAANSASDYFFNPALRLDTTDFIVGGAGTATALTATFMGEIGVAG